MKIGELFVELGFKADSTKLKDFMQSIGDLNMSTILATMGLGGMYELVKKIMSVAENTAMGIDSFGQETGLSTKKMQQWSTAAEMMGAKGDDITASLRNIQSHLTGLKLGMDSTLLTPFAILNRVGAGITGQEDPFTLLQKVGLVINKLTPDMRRLVVEQMGLNDSMLLVLNNIDKFNRLARDQIYTTQEQTASILENRSAWIKVGKDWNTVFTDLGAILAPVLQKMALFLDSMIRIVHNSPMLQSALIAIGAGLSALALAMALPALIAFISGFGELALIVAAVAAGLTLIVMNLEKIKDMAKYVTSGGPVWSAMGGAGLWNQILPASMGIIGGSSTKTTTNTYHFKVFSNDPDEAARKISEILRRVNNDAEMTSPVENN